MEARWSQYDLTAQLAKKYSHVSYLASPSTEPERQVLLTVYASSLFRFPHERENWLKKVQSIKDCQHPHLVPIVDMGIEEGHPFVVREYLPSKSLRSHLKQISPDRLELREALTIISQVGQALMYLHHHHLIHGNVKPENILLQSTGQAILADISLIDTDAIIRDQSTQEYAFCYLAPEQFAGSCDARSDQYALGCLTYELIAGNIPFAARTLTSMMGQPTNILPAPFSQSVADLSPSLEAAVLKTLARDPAERFFDFSLFLEVIRSVLLPPPAFPLLRSPSSRKMGTLSHPVASVPTKSIRKRANRRVASELAEASVPSLAAQNEMAEPAETHPIIGASAPEQSEAISQTELLTSALQSQRGISSLSLDTETDNASPDYSCQGQKESGGPVMMVGTTPLSQVFAAQLAMDPQITEEEQDEAWLTNLFGEEDPSSLGATANSANEQEEDLTSNVVSLSTSSVDRLGPVAVPTQRSRREKVLKLALLLSVIMAVTTAGLWLSGLVPFGMSSYLAPFTKNNSQAKLRTIPTHMLVDIPNIPMQALPTTSATANSNQNAPIVPSNPNAEKAGLIGANTSLQPNTANTGSNPSTANAGSSSSSIMPTPTPTPVVLQTTTIDDSIQGTGTNQFNYVGNWSHCTNCGSELYNNSNSWDHTTPNDYVTLTFTGVQIRFYSVLDTMQGIGAVSLDGGSETMLDFYAATRAGDQLVWTSPMLSAGTHTFKLRVTGNKNPSSSDICTVVDRVDILS